MDTKKVDVKKPSNIQFQLIFDAPNIFLSTIPNSNKMRANITGLGAEQIENIIDCIKDAGPEAYSYLKKLVDQT